MKAILNSFRIRLNTFRLSCAAITRGMARRLNNVKTVSAPRFDLKKEVGREHCELPFGIIITGSGAEVPVEIVWSGDEEGFEVAIKPVRKGVRSGKSSKRGLSGAGVPLAGPIGVCAARLHELAGGTPAPLAAD